MVTRQKQFTLTLDGEDKKLVVEAAKIESITYSSFVRRAAVVHAREVLLKNKQEISSE